MADRPTLLFCVGAAKAGTSWLFRHLAQHPDCWLRSIKELHYFDMLERRTEARARRMLTERIATLRAETRPRAAVELRDAEDWMRVISRSVADFDAYAAYLRQGNDGRPLVADITPAYALLPEARLAAMAALQDDTRFLYLLRDPVSRLWSQARMLARRRVAKGAADMQRAAHRIMERLIDRIDDGEKDREDYAGAIGRLRAVVPAARLMIQLTDDLLSVRGLALLHRFLGIREVPGNFDRNVHEGAPLVLTGILKRRAQAALRPQYDFVAGLFPELPESWRKNMSEALA